MHALSLLFLFGAVLYTQAALQNITVIGTAVCNKKRIPNVKVQLYDKDTFDPNDLLGEVHTNAEGEFRVYGEEDEVGKIEPFVRVTHNCQAKTNCARIGDYVVPQEKIGGTYDMTYVTLDIVVKGEKESC